MDKIVIYDTETTNSTIWGSIIEVGVVVVDKNLNVESFGPSRSQLGDVNSGSSTYSKWGLNDNQDDDITVKRRRQKKKCKDEKDEVCNVVCPKKEKCNDRRICRNCDITLNKDIDK